MKQKKRILILLTAFLVFVLCACSSKKENDVEKPKKKTVKNCKVGDEVHFGDFEWKVLDIQNGNALLLTKDVVETYPYNDKYKNVQWIGSHLRWYLNYKFILEHFTEEEQKQIVETMNTTEDNAWFDTYGGGNSKDNLFLLSVEEVLKYFGDSGSYEKRPEDKLVTVIEDEYMDARAATHDGAKSSWWLRTPGSSNKMATIVLHSGRLDVGGYFVQKELGVRPSMLGKNAVTGKQYQ